MRIIAGEKRGQTILAPKGIQTRPTSNRVREALFSILQARVYGANILDLFSGSGAVALEALSRGARHAVCVDNAPQALKVLQENIHKLGYSRQLDAVYGSCPAVFKRLSGPFDMVFMDPPYGKGLAEEALLHLKGQSGLLSPDALIIVEHEEPLSFVEGFSVMDERKYGRAILTFYQRSEDE
ncbi:MAG: 16S rRNA (guanine(966)-N(2))-methyltransferase RsmD [Christensenellales bacterium]